MERIFVMMRQFLGAVADSGRCGAAYLPENFAIIAHFLGSSAQSGRSGDVSRHGAVVASCPEQRTSQQCIEIPSSKTVETKKEIGQTDE